jgi:hypothetical protein
MLHSIPVALATASLLGTAPPPADALASRRAIDLPRLANQLDRTPGVLPRLTTASFDFILRLFLYWGMSLLLRKQRLAAAAAAEAGSLGPAPATASSPAGTPPLRRALAFSSERARALGTRAGFRMKENQTEDPTA